MLDHKTGRKALPRPLQRLKETVSKRQTLINEINFTYRRLLRLLPAIIKRVDGEEVANTLREQDRADEMIRSRLGHVAAEHGTAPEACTCEEADALVEGVRHADRAARTRTGRSSAVIAALIAVRAFLIRLWGLLLTNLSAESHPKFRKEVKELQDQEAELHRELVSLSQRPEAAPEGS